MYIAQTMKPPKPRRRNAMYAEGVQTAPIYAPTTAIPESNPPYASGAALWRMDRIRGGRLPSVSLQTVYICFLTRL